MNTLISKFFILAVLMGTLVASGAMAQTNEIEFKAPGPFVAGQTSFPAGTYTLRQSQDDLTAWEIFSDSKSASAWLLTEPMDSESPMSKTELTFRKYGNTLVLKQIWVQGNVSYVVHTDYAERKAAKAGTPTKVAVPAQKK